MSAKYVCDRCGKEVPDDGRFFVGVGKKGSASYYHPTDWHDKDLCQDCADRVIRMTFARAATINPDFEDAVRKMTAGKKAIMPEPWTQQDASTEEPSPEIHLNVSGLLDGMVESFRAYRDIVSELVGITTKKTNLDRLRELSAEELAEQLVHGKCCCLFCERGNDGSCDDCDDVECLDGIITWLTSEVEDE